MSALWTAAEAAAATGGRATGDWEVTGVSIDTRTLAPGDLFVALKDRRDGHDFVADALARGAGAALVSHVPPGVSPDAPLLIVDEVLPGLERLGRAARARTGARVIGVTGSVGKTSTKEMLRAALASLGRVHAAEKSYNNHWGVPLTLARMPRDTDVAVIEIGMNHPGEIAPLARLARLHVAIVTTVAPAHFEAFGSLEGIAREKASIFEGLEPEGIAVFHADIETAPILDAAAVAVGARRLRFGKAEDAEWRLLKARVGDGVTVAEARDPDGTPRLFKVRSAGQHFASNALAVLAAGQVLGADPAVVAADLGAWLPAEGRGTRERIALDRVDDALWIDLIDDAYNANPASLAAAIEVLAAASPADGVGRTHKGRRILLVGDMLELGPKGPEMHAAIARLSAMERIDKVHAVGPLARHLHAALPSTRRGEWHETSDGLAHRVHALLDAGDVVLAKGSLGARLSVVVDAIRKLGHRPATHDNEAG